ncbi:unnamed protein product [Heligmosomoides polygyrus]|uniref:Uncharacterized protein n=1 Tax=Heligmosomoides polygyrus TaxID=6339 RepID=A0A183F9K8_HELPZ|nr:unnamed protein product [Heligmosomoides polygyrus]
MTLGRTFTCGSSRTRAITTWLLTAKVSHEGGISSLVMKFRTLADGQGHEESLADGQSHEERKFITEMMKFRSLADGQGHEASFPLRG